MAAPRQTSRRAARAYARRAFVPLFVLAAAFSLLPVWTVDTLPLGDYGAHLEQMDIVARYDDPGTLYAEVYTLPDEAFHPNSLSLTAAALLGEELGVETVGRLLLSFYLVGFPLGVLALCAAFGRSRWLAFFAFPLSFNAIFNVGFLNYLIALPLLLLAIALARRVADRGGRVAGVTLGALLVATFYAHVIAHVIALAIALAFIALFAVRLRDLSRLLWILPSVIPLALWVDRTLLHPVATEAGRSFTSAGLGLAYSAPLTKLQHLSIWGLQLFRTPIDNIVVWLLILAWLGLVLAARRGQSQVAAPAGWRAWLRYRSLGALLVCCALAFVAMPSHMSEVEVIAERVVVLLWLLTAIWPRINLSARLTRRSLGLLIAVALVFPWVIRHELERFDRTQVGELRGALAALPDRSRLAFAGWDISNPITYMGPILHLPKAFHALDNGGISDESFATRPTSPVQYREGQTPARISLVPLADPSLRGYDYLLLRTRHEPTAYLIDPSLRTLFRQGSWYLFEVLDRAPPEGARVVVQPAAGGEERNWRCADERVGSGLTVETTGTRLLNLSLRCGPAPGAAGGTAAVEGPGLVKPRRQRRSPLTLRLTSDCPSEQVLVGLHGRRGPLVDALGAICRPPSAIRALELNLDGWRGPVRGGREGEPFELACPDGTLAVGFAGRAGARLDAAGLICQAP